MIDHLPDDPTQLTAESLTSLFRDGGLAPSNPGVEVVSVTAEPLAEGSAFLGSLARLNITWADPDTVLPNRFVAKFPTRDPGGRTVGKMLNVWAREAQFYAHLAPLVPTPVPACRANFISGDRAGLLLDDMYPASPGDQIKHMLRLKRWLSYMPHFGVRHVPQLWSGFRVWTPQGRRRLLERLSLPHSPDSLSASGICCLIAAWGGYTRLCLSWADGAMTCCRSRSQLRMLIIG